MKHLFLLFCLLFSVSGFSQTKEKETAEKFMNYIFKNADFKNSYQMFSETAKQNISEEQFSQAMFQLTLVLGKFQKVREVHVSEGAVYFYSTFDKQTLDVVVPLNENLEVNGIFVNNHKEFFQTDNNSLSITNDGISLPGTLLLVKENNQKKMVVLIHGSGPQDRDQTIGQLKPFKEIADYLFAQGISSYRYDKRTLVAPKSFNEKSTPEDEVVADVRIIVSYLKEHYPEYQIILLGHSLGAYLLPRIINTSSAVSKAIFLAAPARGFDRILLEQVTYLNQLDSLNVSNEMLNRVKTQVELLHSDKFNLKVASTELPLNLSASYWDYLLKYKPLKEVKLLYLPMFFAQGGKDYQVSETDFNLWKQILFKNTLARFKFYPDLTHLFFFSQDVPSPKDYNKSEPMNKEFLKDLSEFILK